jgi:peptidyl-prolyl cis-trans isomerase A (cyclophilin A)
VACTEKPQSAGQSAPAAPKPPEAAAFTLSEALAGLTGTGTLSARIETNQGVMVARLFEREVPMTVANFVGLARGTRQWQDPKSGDWVKRPLYDGTLFHRVIPDFMIQGGDPLGMGTGGPGYQFADEFRTELRHDRPGVLSMANAGPGTNGSQFFITERPTPHLDGHHTVFGVLTEGLEVEKKIARVPAAGASRPTTPVVIQKITIFRQ